MTSFRSSGDLTADRRFDYALRYREGGNHAAAAELMAQALELAPRWAAGWLALGEAREAAGDTDGAASAYAAALALDAADAAGAGARLARLGRRAAEGAVSPAHIAALFDDYAPRFEKALVEGLGYRGPALMRAALETLAPRRFAAALDLGCGTGLAGAAFADLCERIDGVDLSADMLAIAAAKAIYGRLDRAEIVAHLASLPAASQDLVLAADVLVYLGDLAAVFAQTARVLRPGGLFIFTVQDGGEEAMRLGPDLRYAHSARALRGWAVDSGFALRTLDQTSTRQDAGRPVPGLIGVAERAPG